MADENTCIWTGRSGKKYTYYWFSIGHPLKAEPGNYIFAKIVNGKWFPVYIGETDDLEHRIANHEKRACALRNGATHIHAHLTVGPRQMRLDEETDLRANYRTPCNEQ